MRPTLRPIANDLSWIVLASAVPAAWVAASLAASRYEPSGANALVLLVGVMALLAGASVSLLMSRELRRALDDLAAEADRVSRERPHAPLKPALRELAAIADGLAAAAARMRQARARCSAEAAPALSAAERGAWRWDLARGTMEWPAAVDMLFRIASDGAPTCARLVALAHPSSRAALVAWLARLARGEEAAPLEFRIKRSDGATRTIRAAAAAEYDESAAPIAVSGRFEDVAGDGPAWTAPSAVEGAPAGEVNAILQSFAANLRQRARAAGIDFGAAIMPGLGPLHGAAQALNAALAILGESVLTCTPRGGRVLLRATPDASHGLCIAFACHRPAALDGLAIAGRMVELNCGTFAAQQIEPARALVTSIGGTLAVEPLAAGGEAVTIVLPRAPATRQAA